MWKTVFIPIKIESCGGNILIPVHNWNCFHSLTHLQVTVMVHFPMDKIGCPSLKLKGVCLIHKLKYLFVMMRDCPTAHFTVVIQILTLWNEFPKDDLGKRTLTQCYLTIYPWMGGSGINGSFWMSTRDSQYLFNTFQLTARERRGPLPFAPVLPHSLTNWLNKFKSFLYDHPNINGLFFINRLHRIIFDRHPTIWWWSCFMCIAS